MAGTFLMENPMFLQAPTPQKTGGIPSQRAEGLPPQKTGGGVSSTHTTPQKTSRLSSTPRKNGRLASGVSGGVSSGAVTSSTSIVKHIAHTHTQADVMSPSRKSRRPLPSARGTGADSKTRSQVQGHGQHTVGRPPGATLLPASIHTTAHTTGLISPQQKGHSIGSRELHHTPLRNENQNRNQDGNEISSKMTPQVTDRQTLH
jgi:hypothetical protein